MSVRFSRPEYWLVESVVDFQYPVGLILDPKLPSVLNRRRHGMSRAEVFEALKELLSRGLIHLSRRCDSESSLQLSDAELDAALDESLPDPYSPARASYYDVSVEFGLTAAGGAAWEEFAAPDWNKYIQHFGFEEGHDEATCCCRDRLEEFLRSYAAAFGAIDPSSVRWTAIVVWEATYWKSLPCAFQVDFRFAPLAPQEYPGFDLIELKRRRLTEAGFFHERDNFCEWR
jgi:hypothetical protein